MLCCNGNYVDCRRSDPVIPVIWTCVYSRLVIVVCACFGLVTVVLLYYVILLYCILNQMYARVSSNDIYQCTWWWSSHCWWRVAIPGDHACCISCYISPAYDSSSYSSWLSCTARHADLIITMTSFWILTFVHLYYYLILLQLSFIVLSCILSASSTDAKSNSAEDCP